MEAYKCAAQSCPNHKRHPVAEYCPQHAKLLREFSNYLIVRFDLDRRNQETMMERE